MYFIEIRSTISQAASPSIHSTTLPRMMTGWNGLSAGVSESATRRVAPQVAGLAGARAGDDHDVVAVRADPDGNGVRSAVGEDAGEVGDRGAVEHAAYVGVEHRGHLLDWVLCWSGTEDHRSTS